MNEEPVIKVGILKAPVIRLRLRGPFHPEPAGRPVTGELEARIVDHGVEVLSGDRLVGSGKTLRIIPDEPSSGHFMAMGVVIGIGFHWEKKEDQVFRGSIRFTEEDGEVRLVNEVPAEEYLASVISSEMNASGPPEMLKAHAIISRSWLLSMADGTASGPKRRVADGQIVSEKTVLRWYDREDHQGFHVCADDHCQRYQGFARTGDPRVRRAVEETKGQVLVHSGGLCDARYSKCCGGVTERFETCWEPVARSCLESIPDRPGADSISIDLTKEEAAAAFIRGRPEAFCNTGDSDLISQVLNDYDHPGGGNFRWEVRYGQEELSAIVSKKSGMDLGAIAGMEPVERGPSGRLVRLRIVGSRRTVVVGKELEIRRWLSPSHLYSSAFIVEMGAFRKGIPESFVLHGAGWGHGVGLCQIGAAVMASGGYGHRDILKHYYRGAKIEQRYGK